MTWFEEGCDYISPQSGFSVIGPLLDTSGELPPWVLDFALMYSDGMHIHLGETYVPLPKREGGGGRIYHLSYHYGRHEGRFKASGMPAFSKSCELRIDIDSLHGRHIHYGGEDHIIEDRLPGLDFDKIDPFLFIQAIEEHRADGKPLHEILGFKVEPAK
jgi:hypothetical protein